MNTELGPASGVAEKGEALRRRSDAVDAPSANSIWRAKGAARCRNALAHAVAPGDRLALLRTLVQFSHGRVVLADEGIRLSSAEGDLLVRFGLASDEKVLRLLGGSGDSVFVSGLEDGLRFEGAPRQLFESASPDAVLLRSTPHKQYKNAAQKAAVRALLTMPSGGGLMVSMPTGSGKSLLFQIAAREAQRRRSGCCIVVITPTVALALDHHRTLSNMAGLEGSVALTGDLKGSARENVTDAFRRLELLVKNCPPSSVAPDAVVSIEAAPCRFRSGTAKIYRPGFHHDRTVGLNGTRNTPLQRREGLEMETAEGCRQRPDDYGHSIASRTAAMMLAVPLPAA